MIILNEDGYLQDLSTWNETIASKLAQIETITLNEQHWRTLHALRQFYQQYAMMPTMRAFLKYLHSECHWTDIDSTQLYTLFPKGPILQGAKIAGLPKPKHCI